MFMGFLFCPLVEVFCLWDPDSLNPESLELYEEEPQIALPQGSLGVMVSEVIPSSTPHFLDLCILAVEP